MKLKKILLIFLYVSKYLFDETVDMYISLYANNISHFHIKLLCISNLKYLQTCCQNNAVSNI